MAHDAVIEIPRGSRVKYEVDHGTGRVFLDRILYTAFGYPTNYGFFENSLGEDGDPLDVLVLVDTPSFSGCLIEVRPIGMLEMLDQGKMDQKILAVGLHNPRYKDVRNYSEIYPHILREIFHFFSVYKDLEGKRVEMIGWHNSAKARSTIVECQKRFEDADGSEHTSHE